MTKIVQKWWKFYKYDFFKIKGITVKLNQLKIVLMRTKMTNVRQSCPKEDKIDKIRKKLSKMA